MLVDAATLKAYWRKWDGPSAKGMIIGAIPGVIFAAWIYTAVDADVFRILIGVICLAFVAFQMAAEMGSSDGPSLAVSSPLCMVRRGGGGLYQFCQSCRRPASCCVYAVARAGQIIVYQATTVVTFWAINWMKFVPYFFVGIFTWDTFMGSLVLAPFALLGAWIGVKLHHLVPERLFFGLTYVLLTLTGIRLMWIALV